MDGYSTSFAHLAFSTVIARSKCFGDEMELAWDMFLRVVKEDIACGDDSMYSTSLCILDFY
jgi:hypothetical protein